MALNPDKLAVNLRQRCLSRETKAVRLARLHDGRQSEDRYHDVNCNGFGRLRRLEKFTLCLDTAAGKIFQPPFRGHPGPLPLIAQSFQLAACNWRCWYCFVDDERLSANVSTSRLFQVSEIVEMYLANTERANVIDLSGGQPDIVPEWTLWMMQELEAAGLLGTIHVWIDDNLSSDLFWKILNPIEINYICQYKNSSRAGCFKGFDEESFRFNTLAPLEHFERQFELFGRFLREGANMYAYGTFTAEPCRDIELRMARFIDRLQDVHPNLPLRFIPLKITPFSATRDRITPIHREALEFQFRAYDAWLGELERRFSSKELSLPYDEVSLA